MIIVWENWSTSAIVITIEQNFSQSGRTELAVLGPYDLISNQV